MLFEKRHYFFNKIGSFLQLFGRRHTAETNFIACMWLLKYNFSVYDQLNGFINVGRKHLQRLSREKCSLLVLLLVRLIYCPCFSICHCIQMISEHMKDVILKMVFEACMQMPYNLWFNIPNNNSLFCSWICFLFVRVYILSVYVNILREHRIS